MERVFCKDHTESATCKPERGGEKNKKNNNPGVTVKGLLKYLLLSNGANGKRMCEITTLLRVERYTYCRMSQVVLRSPEHFKTAQGEIPAQNRTKVRPKETKNALYTTKPSDKSKLLPETRKSLMLVHFQP